MRRSVWKLVEERTQNSVQIWREVKEPSEANWTNNKWAAGGERCLWELHKSNGDRGNCWIKSRIHRSRGGNWKWKRIKMDRPFCFEWRGLKVSALGAAKENGPTEGVCVPLISPQAIVALADSKKNACRPFSKALGACPIRYRYLAPSASWHNRRRRVVKSSKKTNYPGLGCGNLT